MLKPLFELITFRGPNKPPGYEHLRVGFITNLWDRYPPLFTLTYYIMSNQITWNNIAEITDNSKKLILQKLESLDHVNSYLNVFVAALGYELGRLCEESDERNYRLAAVAAEALWGNLYECDSDHSATAEAAQIVTAFKKESDAWINLFWLMSITQFIHEYVVYIAGQSSENGNTNALAQLAHHKANLASLNDIYDCVSATVTA